MSDDERDVKAYLETVSAVKQYFAAADAVNRLPLPRGPARLVAVLEAAIVDCERQLSRLKVALGEVRNVERLSRQYSELAHAAWYAPLDEELRASHAETLAEMEADRVRLQEATLEVERLRKAAGGTDEA